jgi:hypothetical protein
MLLNCHQRYYVALRASLGFSPAIFAEHITIIFLAKTSLQERHLSRLRLAQSQDFFRKGTPRTLSTLLPSGLGAGHG